MNSYCWVLLAISLAGLYGSGLSNPCFEAITRFSESHMMTVPVYCQEIQMDITNNMSYRFDLSESTVNDICDESNNMICLEALQMITLICANFVSMQLAYCSPIVCYYMDILCSLKRILTAWILPR